MDKKERFKKVAETRTEKILKMLELLGNCSNKNNYEYTDAQVKKIFSSIEKELEKTKIQFKNKDERGKFKL